MRGGGLLCLVTLGLLRSAAGVIDIELLPIAHGLIIDAGSGGSRMHVYQWEPRLFATLPPPISFPESRNTWTGRLSPGISSYAEHPWDIGEHLRPLIEFAKNILKDHEDNFYKFPLYLRATGGMRQLPVAQRARIMDHIRWFLYSEESPFYFEYDFARVVSGEEEGIYAWAAINFLKGHLLLDSGGSGTANSNVTVGALDMGGASTQIAFFRQDQDIMSNLFKLQVGAQKHWNVYVHSFLYFGEASTKLRMQQACVDTFNGLAPHERMLRVMSAALAPKVQVQGPKVEVGDKFNSEFNLLDAVDGDARMVRLTAPTGELAYFPVHPRDAETGAQRRWRPRVLASAPMPMKTEESQGKTVTVVTAADYGGDAQSLPQVVDACMHIGTEFVFEAADGGTYALVPALEGSDFDACKAQVEPLLHKQLNTWCNFAHSGQCSLAGIYQPELPHARNRQFYAFSGYRRAWSIMGLPEEIKLQEFEEQARVICSMTLDQLQERNELLGKPLSAKAILGACFSSTYAITLLIDGYGFSLDTSVNFVKNLAGYKVGWALGSMLYEINALPWKYVGPGSDDYKRKHSGLKPGADPSGKTSHKGHHHKHAVAIEEGKAKKLKHKKGDHHYKSKKKDDKKHKKHHKTHHGKHKSSKLFALGGGGGDDGDSSWLSIITTAVAGVAALIAAAAAGAVYGRRHERAARATELNLNLQLQEGPPAAAAAAASCVYGSDGSAAAGDAEEAAALLPSRGSGRY